MQVTSKQVGQISTVIPCYNARGSVARAVASVEAQGDIIDQVIVVDDGSSDGSLDVLYPLAEAGRIVLITGPNKGGCHARNRGLKCVRSPYVMFLDADDVIEGDIFEGAVRAANVAGADIVFSPMEIRMPSGASDLRAPVGPPAQDSRAIFAGWFDGGWIGTCSVVWRSEFVKQIGGWDETLRVGQDGDLVLRALLADAVPARSELGRGIYFRDNPGSVSMSGGVSEAKLKGQIELIGRMNGAARAKGWGDVLERNHAALYFLARKAFMAGYTVLGRAALAQLHNAGHRSHHGTRAHNILAAVIGLERKVRWFGS